MARRIKFKATFSILLADDTHHAPYINTVLAFMEGRTAGFGPTAAATKTVCRMEPGDLSTVFAYDIEADPPLPPWDDTPVKKPAKRRATKRKQQKGAK